MKHLFISLSFVALACFSGFAQSKHAGNSVNQNVKNSTVLDQAGRKVQISTASNAYSTPKSMLFSNGSIVTNPGGGAGGADLSIPYDNNSLGSGVQLSADNSIAVNFNVIDQSWTLDSVRLYTYQTGSTTTSTITDARIRIWSGTPGQAGSTIVWGDTITNRMTSTRWSNCYRGADATATTRPLMVVVCNTTGAVLNQGNNYWIEFIIGGTLTSGPWCPPIAAGSDMQSIASVWATTTSEYPVDVYGTAVAATCPPVSNIVFSNVLPTSVSVDWTSNGTETLWDIEVVPDGSTATGTPTYNNVTAHPYVINSLTANTKYTIYVRSDCGSETSGWSSNVVNTDLCLVANKCDLQFVLSDSYGDGWDASYISVVQAGTEIAQVKLASGASGNTTVPVCDGASISLQWVTGSDYDDEAGFKVYSVATDDTLFTHVAGTVPTPGELIAFTNSCTPPTCLKPTNLTATGMTLVSAQLGWTEAGTATQWNIEWGAGTFAQGTGTVINAVTANPYTLNGLTAGTNYSFYVQASCGGSDVSAWAGPFSFATLCNTVTSLPYNNGFESGLTCWTVQQTNTAETWSASNDVNEGSPNSGSWWAQVLYDAALAAQDEWLISPEFNMTGVSNVNVSFFWNGSYNWSVTNDNCDLKFAYTLDNGTTWTELWNEESEGTFTDWTYYKDSMAVPAADNQASVKFGFHYTGTDGAAFYIDDFSVYVSNGIEVSTLPNVLVYPNPAKEQFNIVNAENAEVVVVNTVGQTVYSTLNTKTSLVVNTSGWNTGVYFVKINDGKSTLVKRVIIK